MTLSLVGSCVDPAIPHIFGQNIKFGPACWEASTRLRRCQPTSEKCNFPRRLYLAYDDIYYSDHSVKICCRRICSPRAGVASAHEFSQPRSCLFVGRSPNGFLGLSLNDRTILFLGFILDKTVFALGLSHLGGQYTSAEAYTVSTP